MQIKLNATRLAEELARRQGPDGKVLMDLEEEVRLTPQREREGGRERETPCFLPPTPSTIHPALYTLHPKPYTLNPAPSTLARRQGPDGKVLSDLAEEVGLPGKGNSLTPLARGRSTLSSR